MKKKDIVALPEREVVKFVLGFFAFDKNVRLWRRNVGAIQVRESGFVRFGEPGQSDIFGLIREARCPFCHRLTGAGVHLEIECKAVGGRLSPAQIEYQKEIRKYGGIAITAIPKPTPDDPTGFNSLTKSLQTLSEIPCAKCAER